MSQSNVVKMERRYHGVHDAEAAMTVVRNAMEPHDVKWIAMKCAVSTGCIYAIKNGKTKWPRATTFFQLLYVLDLEMVIRPRG